MRRGVHAFCAEGRFGASLAARVEALMMGLADPLKPKKRPVQKDGARAKTGTKPEAGSSARGSRGSRECAEGEAEAYARGTGAEGETLHGGP